jgi:hypothetical protein
MAETKSAPKSLYDLAKALDRWDDEGGAAESSRADLGPASTKFGGRSVISQRKVSRVTFRANAISNACQRNA